MLHFVCLRGRFHLCPKTTLSLQGICQPLPTRSISHRRFESETSWEKTVRWWWVPPPKQLDMEDLLFPNSWGQENDKLGMLVRIPSNFSRLSLSQTQMTPHNSATEALGEIFYFSEFVCNLCICWELIYELPAEMGILIIWMLLTFNYVWVTLGGKKSTSSCRLYATFPHPRTIKASCRALMRCCASGRVMTARSPSCRRRP